MRLVLTETIKVTHIPDIDTLRLYNEVWKVKGYDYKPSDAAEYLTLKAKSEIRVIKEESVSLGGYDRYEKVVLYSGVETYVHHLALDIYCEPL